MFNWLKRKTPTLNDWGIGDVAGFEFIRNDDSIQYFNEDSSKVIYFSLLKVDGPDTFSLGSHAGKPTILEDENGWQVKGTKKSQNQVLICLISVNKHEDIEWEKIFFNAITPR